MSAEEKGNSLLQWAILKAENEEIGFEITKAVATAAVETDSNIANYQNTDGNTCLHLMNSRKFTASLIAFLMRPPFNADASIKNNKEMTPIDKTRNKEEVFAAFFME